MKRTILACTTALALGLLASAALANPDELCKKWPNNAQCQPPTTTTTPTPPPTTTEPPPTTTEPPPTTTEPPPTTTSPPPTTTQPGSPSPKPPSSPPPTTDLPLTGAPWYWFAGFAAFLITVGTALLVFGRKPDA